GGPAMDGLLVEVKEHAKRLAGPVDLHPEAGALALADRGPGGAAEPVRPDLAEAAGQVEHVAAAFLDPVAAGRAEPGGTRALAELDLGGEGTAPGHVGQHGRRLRRA